MRAMGIRLPIRVLVVEDSPSQRALLMALLEADGSFDIVGTASSGTQAVAAAERLRPDIIAMDIVLPAGDGFQTTRQIMQRCPTRIVLVSSASDAAQRSLDALAVGALAVVRKPGSLSGASSAADRATLLTTLRVMAGVPVVTRYLPRAISLATSDTRLAGQPQIVAIAASTGGPLALQTVLRGLGADFPLPVLVVQHISRGFVTALVDWLADTVPLPVSIATHAASLQAGQVYVAPDQQHLTVQARGAIALCSAVPNDSFCPSADRLFSSVAHVYGSRALGVVLTGMGDDGVRGLQALALAGSVTIAQDEASSVVYGMPRAAVVAGAVTQVAPLAEIGSLIRHLVGGVSATEAGQVHG